MKSKTKDQMVWVFVTVQSGIPVDAVAYKTRRAAKLREATWRRTMNEERDAAGVFPVPVK